MNPSLLQQWFFLSENGDSCCRIWYVETEHWVYMVLVHCLIVHFALIWNVNLLRSCQCWLYFPTLLCRARDAAELGRYIFRLTWVVCPLCRLSEVNHCIQVILDLIARKCGHMEVGAQLESVRDWPRDGDWISYELPIEFVVYFCGTELSLYVIDFILVVMRNFCGSLLIRLPQVWEFSGGALLYMETPRILYCNSVFCPQITHRSRNLVCWNWALSLYGFATLCNGALCIQYDYISVLIVHNCSRPFFVQRCCWIWGLLFGSTGWSVHFIGYPK